MAYADYTFYTTVYLGNVIPSADFNRLAQRSSDIIDIFTGNKIDNTVISDEETYTKIKKANCALAEQIYYKEQNKNIIGGYNSSAISSIKAGEETITFGVNKSGNSSYEIQKDEYKTALSTISLYLFDTGLLYMGIKGTRGIAV